MPARQFDLLFDLQFKLQNISDVSLQNYSDSSKHFQRRQSHLQVSSVFPCHRCTLQTISLRILPRTNLFKTQHIVNSVYLLFDVALQSAVSFQSSLQYAFSQHRLLNFIQTQHPVVIINCFKTHLFCTYKFSQQQVLSCPKLFSYFQPIPALCILSPRIQNFRLLQTRTSELRTQSQFLPCPNTCLIKTYPNLPLLI